MVHLIHQIQNLLLLSVFRRLLAHFKQLELKLYEALDLRLGQNANDYKFIE